MRRFLRATTGDDVIIVTRYICQRSVYHLEPKKSRRFCIVPSLSAGPKKALNPGVSSQLGNAILRLLS
jgi:hypothetical protein